MWVMCQKLWYIHDKVIKGTIWEFAGQKSRDEPEMWNCFWYDCGHISLGASLINELEKKWNSIMWWIKRGTLGIACAVRNRPEKKQPYLSRKWGRWASDGNMLFKVWQKRGSASKEREESCLRNGGTKSLHKVPLMHSREGWCTPCYSTEGET